MATVEKIKTATWRIAAIFVECPHCGDGVIGGSKGSFMLTHEEATNGLGPRVKLQCTACSGWFRMPVAMGKL